jgi:hypothetical protein
MLQRGRKGALQRSMIGLQSNLNVNQPVRFPPPPSRNLAEPERKVWYEILRKYDFNYAGEFLLESALLCRQRVRECRATILKDGVLVAAAKGGVKRHPLLSIEAANHKLMLSLFRQLQIDYREEWL